MAVMPCAYYPQGLLFSNPVTFKTECLARGTTTDREATTAALALLILIVLSQQPKTCNHS